MTVIDHKKIADHAKENRWSAAAVAEKTGFSNSTVAKIFNGESTNPGSATLKAVCDVIGLPVEEVFIETERAAA